MAMKAVVVLVISLVAGCGGGGGAGRPDAGPAADARREGCVVPDATGFDFFGESCHAEPFPVNTECHGGAGWCVADVCRPTCGQGCPRCAAGALTFTAAGACYCSPG